MHRCTAIDRVRNARPRLRRPSRRLVAAHLLTGLAAMVPLTGHTQSSITLYGQVDTGINYRTSAGADPATGKAASAVSLVSGNEFTSRWGMYGVEDIGAGTKITFRLESGFNAATGSGNFALPFPNDTNSLFDRSANVGVVSPVGTVLFGRVWSPLYDAMMTSDATGFSNFASLSSAMLQNSSNLNPKLGLPGAAAGVNSAVNGGLMYLWVNNAIKVSIPANTYGFSGSALYSFGGTAGDVQNKSTWSANLNWTNGTLGLVSGYFSAKDPTGLTDNTWLQAFTVGATYVIGSTRTGLNYTKFRNPTTGANQNWYYVSESWYVTPAFALSGDWMHVQDLRKSSAGGDIYKVGMNYFLSKSSTLYADVGYANNKSQGILGAGINSSPLTNPATIGHNQLAIGAGLRKWF
ncbi:porin [Caballeronia sp. S22]|uniref:porin n=1 Tax=Caballeronia sp. S22 TaxID=3137182 RepID=UPI003530DBBE